MGQTLSSPQTAKHSESGGNDRFLYGVSEMQGWRVSMEDAHAISLDLDGTVPSNSFFAVYDGHGGQTVARFAGKNVHRRLTTEESYRTGQYSTAMKRAFLGTDEDILADPSQPSDPSGCTAVAALVTTDGKIYVANAGDSRSVLSINGVVKPLSFDHKPYNEVERARISGAGGYIEYGRVNGNLALSRALGDFEFKKNYSLIPENQIITANPDVTIHEITAEDEFLVLACDGIWDCMSSQDVVNFVRRKVWERKELEEIGEMMCDHCLAPDTFGAGIGCDNMTVLIIALLQGRTKEEWYAWMHDRVELGYGFETPMNPPQIYSQSRLMSFRLQREAREEREYERDDVDGFSAFFGSSGMFGGVGHVLGSGGGVSFHPGSGIMSDNGPLNFGNDDSDSDDGEDAEDEMMFESDGGRSLFGHSLDFERHSPDSMPSLRDRLAEFELEISDSHIEEVDDGHSEPDAITPDSPSSSPQQINGDVPIPAAAQTEGKKEGSSVPSDDV